MPRAATRPAGTRDVIANFPHAEDRSIETAAKHNRLRRLLARRSEVDRQQNIPIGQVNSLHTAGARDSKT